MARKYSRDNAGRFASGGTGATARGGRLKTASGGKRATQTMTAARSKPAGAITGRAARTAAGQKVMGKLVKRPVTPTQGAVTVSPQKQRLANAAKRRNAQADKLDAKVSQLQKQYRDKGTAFYTQPVKTPGRDAMYRKMQQANKLREESAALRTKAQNAQRMSDKIKAKPAKASGGNTKMARAIANEQTYSQRPKAKRRNSRATALRAQEIYKKNDTLANVGLYDMAKRGFRLPRDQRRKT